MEIIRDEENFGIMMIPLFMDWGVKRCNVKNCTNEPSTIITSITPEISVLGLCEIHYKEMADAGRVNHTMVFNDFDAFEYKKQQKIDDEDRKQDDIEHNWEMIREARKEIISDDPDDNERIWEEDEAEDRQRERDRQDEAHFARYGN